MAVFANVFLILGHGKLHPNARYPIAKYGILESCLPNI